MDLLTKMYLPILLLTIIVSLSSCNSFDTKINEFMGFKVGFKASNELLNKMNCKKIWEPSSSSIIKYGCYPKHESVKLIEISTIDNKIALLEVSFLEDSINSSPAGDEDSYLALKTKYGQPIKSSRFDGREGITSFNNILVFCISQNPCEVDAWRYPHPDNPKVFTVLLYWNRMDGAVTRALSLRIQDLGDVSKEYVQALDDISNKAGSENIKKLNF